MHTGKLKNIQLHLIQILIQLQKKDLTTLIFVNLKFINTFASGDVGLPRPKKIINKSNNNLIV